MNEDMERAVRKAETVRALLRALGLLIEKNSTILSCSEEAEDYADIFYIALEAAESLAIELETVNENLNKGELAREETN
ncbi:MAG: hypothetical protein LUD12_13330 [Lachnospiraceae bacterium]|nr:hypothetical protein [Lachnospiraceae bacterium]